MTKKKKKKKAEQPTKFQWDPTQVGEVEDLPEIRNLESDVEQGHIDEDARKFLERRQAQTGRVMQSILSGRFGW